MTAWKLAQSNIKYVGMPEKEYVFYDTLLTDMVGGGNVAYFFEVFLDNGKRILIHTKSAHGEVSHRKKEFAGHALFTLFRRQYDKFVRRNDVEEMVLVLDGTWRGTPDPYSNIRPLYYSGFTRIFYPQPLDEEWDLVKYLLKKGALVERESR